MTAKSLRHCGWLIAVLMLCGGQWSLAQFSANVQGTVTDSTGAVIPRVAVNLHNTGTGVDLKQVSNGSGFYRFTSIAPGNYLIEAELNGFRSVSTAVTVSTGETRGVDISLSPAGADTSVTVNAVASALNTEETRVQQTLSASEISKLPLPNRDVQLLIALTPGVTGFQNESASNGYGSSIFAGNFQPNYSANGQASNGNLFLIDDLPVSDEITQGAAMILPNADMISQVSLQTQTYSVENGTAGSLQTSYSTKSGSNRFHGTADYSYAGANVGASAQPTHSLGNKVVSTLPDFHQNLILASLGGPIVKDRTFFFGSIEKQNALIGTASGTNPYFTPSFEQWAANAFPNSPTAYGLNFAPATRDIGGTIKTAQDFYPDTCGTTQTVSATQDSDSPLTYNIPCDQSIYAVGGLFNQTQPFNGLQWNVRLDQTLRDGKDRIYVMYERIDQKLGNLSERPKLDGVTPSQNKYFSVNYLHVFNPKLLNEVHFGNLRAIAGSTLQDPRAASIPYEPILLDKGAGFLFTFPFGSPVFAAQTNKEHTYALRDTLSYTLHNHSIRAGYQFYRGDAFQDSSKIYSRPFVPFYLTDTFSFISNTASAGYNLYTIGGATGKFVPQYYGASSRYNGVFVEDSWKVRQNLTLTVGLRYDNFGNPVPYGATAQPFAPIFPGSGSTFQEQAWNTTTRIASKAFTESQNPNFMPRAGFAYSPMKSNPFLVRGGIGLYETVQTPFQIAANLPTQPPNRISLYTNGIVPYGDFKTMVAPFGYQYNFPVYGTDPSGNIYSNPERTEVYSADLNSFIPTLKPEKFLNYSFGVEQQLMANLLLSITYVGSHGYDLLYGSATSSGGANADYNLKVNSPTARPTKEWGKLNYGRNGLSSNFNELVVVLKQNYKGLSYQANYNWAKALQYAPTTADTTQAGNFNIWKGIYDPKSYYGPSAFDVRNSFTFGGAYEVPKFTENHLLHQAASGWRLSSLLIAQTGTPFTVLKPGVDYQNDGSASIDGPQHGTPGFPTYSGSKRSGFSRTEALAGAFTTSQFTDPAGVGKGPVTAQQGANTFRNLGYFTVNAGVAKAFSFPLPGKGEVGKLILRGEAVNLLNRTNWNNFQVDTTDGNFGTVTGANQKRYLQIGGRIEF